MLFLFSYKTEGKNIFCIKIPNQNLKKFYLQFRTVCEKLWKCELLHLQSMNLKRHSDLPTISCKMKHMCLSNNCNPMHLCYSYHYDAQNMKQNKKIAIWAWQSPTSSDMAVKRLTSLMILKMFLLNFLYHAEIKSAIIKNK